MFILLILTFTKMNLHFTLMNSQGEKSLEIVEVYAEKIKVKVYVNQQNCVS